MAAVVTTPLLVKLLVGSIVPVNAAALVFSTIQVSHCGPDFTILQLSDLSWKIPRAF